VIENTGQSPGKSMLKDDNISEDLEQNESEVVSKYRANTTKLEGDKEKSNSTRKSIVIKSNRTNRARI
jgi:hypothetical protein